MAILGKVEDCTTSSARLDGEVRGSKQRKDAYLIESVLIDFVRLVSRS
jgi:hypothetical protein